jgi:hypothetical protein
MLPAPLGCCSIYIQDRGGDQCPQVPKSTPNTCSLLFSKRACLSEFSVTEYLSWAVFKEKRFIWLTVLEICTSYISVTVEKKIPEIINLKRE